MKTTKIAEASGTTLDWLVAKCEGLDTRNNWIVEYIPFEAESDDPMEFICFADNALHAVEQVENAYPNCTVVDYGELEPYRPSTNWAQGGPIFEREGISVGQVEDGSWWAGKGFISDEDTIGYQGSTPLVAAMRCYVASKLGDTAEVPEELL